MLGTTASFHQLSIRTHVITLHTKQVNWFHKGLATKYEVVMESGHIAAAKPIQPDKWWPVRVYQCKQIVKAYSEIRIYHFNHLSPKRLYSCTSIDVLPLVRCVQKSVKQRVYFLSYSPSLLQEKVKTVKYLELSSVQRANIRRAEWEFQVKKSE